MELPPQIVKHQVRNLAATQDALALRSGAGLQAPGNRLPVLQAFQEFLEIERRKARRRLVAVGSVFLALLLLILATASILYLRLTNRVQAEIIKLENALALAREETSALRGDGDAMRQALADAQQAVEALRLRAERTPEQSAPIDLALFASTLDLLRRLQDLQPELTEWSRRVEALKQEADALVQQAQVLTERRMRWRAERRAWEAAFASFQERRARDSEAWAAAIRDLDAASGGENRRGLFGRRAKTAAPPPDPTPAWLAMEAMTQSKFQLPGLISELERLEREALSIQESRRESIRRSDAWREEVHRVTEGIQSWRGRCAELAQSIPARADGT